MAEGGRRRRPRRPEGRPGAPLLALLLIACQSTEPPLTRPDGGAILPLVCQPAQSICESQCVDTQTDELHCGGCNQPCTGGTECRNGSCACPEGLTLCSGVCVDLLSDSGNCRGCGITCLDGRICDAGACVCPPAFAECNGLCVDLETSEDHCGDCDFSCSPLQTCEAMSCGCGDLSACPGGRVGYCSSDLERHCCTPGELFCDVDDAIAFPGGCIPGGLDCDNLIPCGGSFVSCSSDRTPFCSSTGSPSCCVAGRQFCDAVAGIGYDGGCWDPEVSCGTITECGSQIFACRGAARPFCSTRDRFVCCGMDQIFCDARANGYEGGCWGSNINCNSITDCGGGNFVACPTGAGQPNCTTNVCE